MIPLVTPFIALIVAGIAFLQWRTAQEKVLLDLFDKRFAVYEDLLSVMARHLGSGIDDPAFYNFVRAVSRAKFLFGHDVQTFLEERRKDLGRAYRRNVEPQPVPEDRSAAVQAERLARADRLSDFPKDFDELVAPYMNHHQKALRQSLVKWLAPQSSRGGRQLHGPQRAR